MYGTPEQTSYKYTYTSDFNQVQTMSDPLAHTRSFGYTAGCLTSAQDALQNTWTLTCNSAGQRTSITEPAPNTNHITSYRYTGYDLTTVIDGMNDKTTMQYDPAGRMTAVIDPLGNESDQTYDTNDLVLSITDAMGQQTTYTYDNNQNLQTITPPTTATSQLVRFFYDTRNRLNKRTDALGNNEMWQYDGFGNITQYVDRDGHQTKGTPDDLARMAKKSYQDGSTTQFTYDSGDRLRTVVDSVAGTITLTPDDFNNPHTEQTPQGTVNYTFDPAERPETMQISGQTTSYVYSMSDADKLTGITFGAEKVQIGLDNSGRRQTLTLPNNIETQYGVDLAGRLQTLTYSNASTGATIGSITYQHDAADRIVSVASTIAPASLSTATSSDYSYDAGDRLLGGNGYIPSFDKEGEMTNDGKGTTYKWNVRQQLYEVDRGSTKVVFSYDGLGRRTSMTVNGVATSYLYDYNNNVVQEQSSGTVNNLIVGLVSDEVFARSESFGRVYYLRDSLFSTVALTNSAGTIVQEYGYDPYGVSSTLMSTTVSNPYTYTGRPDDADGLYFYRARYYSAATGRFASEDPIGLAGVPNVDAYAMGGNNRYAYVMDNPISMRDPTGLKPPKIPNPIKNPIPWGCLEAILDCARNIDNYRNGCQDNDEQSSSDGSPPSNMDECAIDSCRNDIQKCIGTTGF